MTALPYNEHRFGGAEPVERDVEPELTEEQYTAHKAALERIHAIRWALYLIDHHLSCLDKLGWHIRDELEGRTGVYRVDMGKAIEGANEYRAELEAGIRAWEQRP